MQDIFEIYNTELKKEIDIFENLNGDLVGFWEKQIFTDLHSMILEDVFTEPDLQCLIEYERELNGGNQTR